MGSSARTQLQVAAFALLYLLAAVVGRTTVLEPGTISLVWPATGVAVVWFLTVRGRRATYASAVLVVVVTLAGYLLVGAEPPLVPILVAGNLAQVAAVVGLVRRWCPELGNDGRPPLESQAGLLRFTAAAAAGCLLGVAAGTLLTSTTDQPFSLTTAVTWWGRNLCSVLAVSTTGLLLVERLTHRAEPTTSGRTPEAVALVCVTSALIVVEHATGSPIAFLLPATTVWAALRFTPLLTSANAALGGAGVIWLTIHDRGLFPTLDSPRGGVLLAQLFVGMTIMIGLFLAAGRREAGLLHAELRERERELASFTRRAVHDLQNPLMIIDGWAGLLAGRLPEHAPEADMVRRVREATGQMRSLVDDLLADASSRDGQLEQLPVDIAALAREIADSRGAGAHVRVGPIDTVLGDRRQLHRLLDNLIGNALKYVAPGDRPAVTVLSPATEGGRVTVAVADRGIGIPANAREAVFEEFVRAHPEAYPGTGLGLSICRRIVERHGGSISAAPRRSGGTVVVFDLAAAPSLPLPRESDRARAVPPERQPWTPTTSPS